MRKATTGNYFEDFETGLEIRHAVPRTVTALPEALSALKMMLKVLVKRVTRLHD